MKQIIDHQSSKQKGIALPIIMIILVLTALVTIYTTTTSVKEQQVTADQYRSEQAFAAAQAGVDVALQRHNYFEDFSEVNSSGDALPAEGDILSGADFSIGSYKAMFCDIWDDNGDEGESANKMAAFLSDTIACTNPITPPSDADGFKGDTRVGILSVGKADDKTGLRIIHQVTAGAKITKDGGSPAQPLVAKSTADLAGGLTVINRYSNSTVWSGEDALITGDVNTYIKDPSITEPLERLQLISDTLDNTILASNKGLGNNADVIDNDYNLANLEGEELFEKIFAGKKEDIKALAEVYTDVSATVPDPAERTGLIWLDVRGVSGDIGDWGICESSSVELDPVLLIIETDKTSNITSTTKVCGFVFVFGDLRITAKLTVIGAMMTTAGVETGSGGATLVYDPNAIVVPPEGLKGSRGIDPGTWKDWNGS